MHSIFRQSRKTAAAAALLSALLIPAAHSELVTNGGFGAGLNGWTVAGSVVTPRCDYAVSGCAVDLFSAGRQLVSLSQTFGTVAGSTYTYSFWIDNSALSDLISFTADGAEVFSLHDPADSIGFLKYSGSFVAADASTTIAINLVGNSARMFLDEVSVLGAIPTNSVPEPVSLVLAGIGLVALALSRRRPDPAA